MSMYEFKYGSKKLNLELNEGNIIDVLHGKEILPIENIRAELYKSVENPIDYRSLKAFAKKKDKVTLIVSDMSRFWMRQDLVIPHIISYLNVECEIPYNDIVILVANGTHENGDESELKQLVTEEIYNKVMVINHDCLAEDLVHIGTTTLGTYVSINPYGVGRKVIALGACTQHVMAGFGGGRKSILPGIASLETIRQNHAHSLDPLSARSNPLIGNGILEKNPLHEDMCEAAAMIDELFMINLVMNAHMELAYIFSGHWLHSWEKSCIKAKEIYEVPINELADIVITSSGGYPKDMSLYQGSKTVDNIESALKLGGTLILLMECREGGGAKEYFDWLEPLKNGKLDSELRNNFTIPGYIFYLNCEQAERYNILMYSSIDKESVKTMGINAFDNLDELISQVNFNGKSVYIIPNGSTVIPKLKEQ